MEAYNNDNIFADKNVNYLLILTWNLKREIFMVLEMVRML